MTFFLKEFDPASQPPRQGPDMRPSGFWEGVGAATSRMMRDTNANLQRQSEVTRETQGIVEQAFPLLGERAVIDRLKSKGMLPDTMEALPPDALRHNKKAQAEILAMAREAAANDPERWNGIDLTDEGIEARVTEMRRAEDQDEAMTIAMMPSGQGVAQLVGGMAGAMADIRQIPFLFASGGGSLLSMMGRQALANAAAEAVTLPSMYETAAELDKADPNPAAQIAIGALGGAAFSAIFDGLPMAVRRGLAYYAARKAIPHSPGVDPVFNAAAVDAAEDALVKGEDPVAAADAILSKPEAQQQDDPNEAPWWTGEREPLIPEREPQVSQNQPQNIPENIQPDDATLAQQAIDQTRALDNKRSRPLAAWIKRGQSDWRGIDPNGPLGQELKARGVNNRTYPGMFRKGGREDLDNLVASEMEEAFPGIMAATRTDPDATYLDYEGFREVLIRDAQGDTSWLQSRRDAMQAEREAIAAERTAVDDYRSFEPAEDGFFVNLDEYEFAGGDVTEAIGQGLDGYLSRKGITNLRPEEIAEIKAQLVKDGGDADYLIERAYERSAYEVEDAAGRGSTAAGDNRPDGQGSGPAEPDAGTARGSGAGQGGNAAAFERTAAGDQSLIPGVPAISQRARLEAAQNARMGGDARGPDSQIGGLFDPGDKVRRDLFDDPAGPKAKPILDAMREDMRDTLDGEDFIVDLGDGPRSAKSLLDEMDGDEDFIAVLDACGKRAVTE